jgi:hypothetical protein
MSTGASKKYLPYFCTSFTSLKTADKRLGENLVKE